MFQRKKISGDITADYLMRRALYHIQKYEVSEQRLREVLLKAVRNRLQRADFDDEDREEPDFRKLSPHHREMIEETISKLVEKNFVNDSRYAESKARMIRNSGGSLRKIEMKLKQAGVDVDTAEMEGFSEDDEFAAALKYCRKKKLGMWRNPDVESDTRKELAKLAGAGFSFAIARRALDYEEADTPAWLPKR